VNGGKGRGEADASASVNKFVKSPIIYKTIPLEKMLGTGLMIQSDTLLQRNNKKSIEWTY
jgi:hypothetical protein